MHPYPKHGLVTSHTPDASLVLPVSLLLEESLLLSSVNRSLTVNVGTILAQMAFLICSISPLYEPFLIPSALGGKVTPRPEIFS